MLVLTRKSNQSIMIGDDIEVSVLSIMGEKVRIGIQAPRDIPVFRKEVYLEIQQENVAAGASARAEVDDALKRLSTNNQAAALRRSAQHVVQRREHRVGHDGRGPEQHEHEQEEAHRPVPVRALAVALELPPLARACAAARAARGPPRSPRRTASSISAMLWRMRMDEQNLTAGSITLRAWHHQRMSSLQAPAGLQPSASYSFTMRIELRQLPGRVRPGRGARSAPRARSSARSTSCASTRAA